MNRIIICLIGSVVALGALFWLLSEKRNRDGNSVSDEPLHLFCAASNRSVMEVVIADYQKECGRSVQVQYGPSQTLLSSLQVSHVGDLFLPADDSYIELAKKTNLVDEILPVASMRAVVAVAKSNPKMIASLDDILKPDVRYVQASADATAIGRITKQVLEPTGMWDRLQKVSKGERLTVTDVASDVAIGAADAGIVYDAVVFGDPKIETVAIPELESAISKVAIGVLKSSKRPMAALHFARYLTAKDRGLATYKDQGFDVIHGDVWEDKPKIAIFAGSMLRPAIEDTIIEFEKREGVEVSRVYNGCGVLVAQMKAGQHPDAYFACDSEFMSQVPDIFPESTDVSQNELVIIVQKGNPHGIKSLQDLSKPGLKVGVGHEKQCAMGWLTQNTFREAGVTTEIMENVKVQVPAGDMLVNQMQTGALDASVVYLSNAAGAGDFLDAIRIEGLKCSVATQPFAIAIDSPRGQTASRLFQKICSVESQSTFQAEGFRWLMSDAKR
jgi:molybdate transport system substrate-binding protein